MSPRDGHTPLDSSSSISSVGYDHGKRSLEVTFKDGATYAYEGVHASTYQTLMSSDSPGQFLHRYIKPHHPGSKL